jgi:tRNA A-37 threonylcarbamoyl transferase component Bud32
MKLVAAVPELRGAVEDWLREPGRGERVKDNRVRSVHRWNGLYVKCFKHPSLLQQLRRLLHDRAAHEFRVLRALRERGIDAPEPVAHATSGGQTYLFTREIPGALPLRSVPLTRPLVLDLARLVRRVLDAGIRHDDLHIGNVLLAGGRLHLVDVHRAAVTGGLGEDDRLRTVAFVLLSLYTFVSASDALRFVLACGADPRRVGPLFRELRDRYYRDRESRVFKTGSDFEVVDGLTLRRPCAADEARKALSAAPLRMVKELPGRRLWLADAETFVKEGAGAAWRNAFALETRGIPTPRLLATDGARVAGRWIEGALPLWEHLKAVGVSRGLLHRLAGILRRMHERGVYHRDLKANNVLVRGDEIWVIDLDRVDLMREVPREGRVWNLAQLNAAVGPPATRSDRLRFFLAYAGRDRGIRTGWKTWVREIMRQTVARRHVWPAPGRS